MEDAGDFAREACRLMPGLVVEAIDARKPEALAVLAPGSVPGQTLALSGSSGVGKSTIVNTMLGTETQSTHDVREHDAHGNATTRGRTMHRLPSGAWLIDTPGMRELQILDSGRGSTTSSRTSWKSQPTAASRTARNRTRLRRSGGTGAHHSTPIA